MNGDSNDKPTAMQSWSVARSQCWTTVSIGTGSLSAPDVNSADKNQPWKKSCCGIPTRVHRHLPGVTLNQYTTWLAALEGEDRPGSGSHSRLFTGLIVVIHVNIWCTKRSGPYRSCGMYREYKEACYWWTNDKLASLYSLCIGIEQHISTQEAEHTLLLLQALSIKSWFDAAHLFWCYVWYYTSYFLS